MLGEKDKIAMVPATTYTSKSAMKSKYEDFDKIWVKLRAETGKVSLYRALVCTWCSSAWCLSVEFERVVFERVVFERVVFEREARELQSNHFPRVITRYHPTLKTKRENFNQITFLVLQRISLPTLKTHSFIAI